MSTGGESNNGWKWCLNNYFSITCDVINVFYSNVLRVYLLSGTHENVYLIVAISLKEIT